MTQTNLPEAIDDAVERQNVATLRELRRSCEQQLEGAQGEERVNLHYMMANASAGIAMAKSDASYAWSWHQKERVKELLSLRKAISELAFDSCNIIRQLQIRTNLGNCLSTLGRGVEAIQEWTLALKLIPKSAMAAGSRGYGICSYAQQLYDSGHEAVLLKHAHRDYATALASDAIWDSGPHPHARQTFERHDQQVTAFLAAIDYDENFNMNSFPLGETEEERSYRSWCLDQRLFLNPLNDVTTESIAAQDVFHLPSHTYQVTETTRFPAYYNRLKQEYISVRYRYYLSLNELDGHFTDRDVLLTDNADGAVFGHHVEELRAAFLGAYAIFDKIALFINDYFRVGIKVGDVAFRRIWSEPGANVREQFESSRNLPLRGLYYLSKDLFEPGFSDFAVPDALSLSDLRNRAEHRFLTVQYSDAHTSTSEEHVYVTLDDFRIRTLKLIHKARAALIYLSLAMHREETIRSEQTPEKLAIPIPAVPILCPWEL